MAEKEIRAEIAQYVRDYWDACGELIDSNNGESVYPPRAKVGSSGCAPVRSASAGSPIRP
jgi:hypothetical protein